MSMLMGRVSVAGMVVGTVLLSGLISPVQSRVPIQTTAMMTQIAVTVVVPQTPPAKPKPFSVPGQPIDAASSTGYLPSSWSVTPKGEFDFAVPLTVPPGRADMAPTLSVEYASGSGSGMLGLGWSLSGFSRITRCGRTWAEDGETDGVDFTIRDRFCLDGQKLVAVNGMPYGGSGTEYRTAPDTFVRIHSTSAQGLDPAGPEQFVVELGDGRIRTYGPVVAQQITFDKDNKAFAHGLVRAEWRIESEQDVIGNTISYEYEDFTGPGGTNASDYWYETRPLRIFYTANLSNGQPTHGLQDLAQRYVKFEYENRPDSESGWVAGVQRHHSSRLKTVKMYAPNPTATALVWQYNLAYAMSNSQRSLLASIQRCESAGGCLWSKQFTYSASSSMLFQTQPVIPAPILKSDYDLNMASAPDGEVPALQVLDLNADGASDLLFGPGKSMLWETVIKDKPPHPVSTGKFQGGPHSLWLSKRNAQGQIEPFGQGLTIPRDEDPLSTATYGHVRLDEATAVDLDGDGKAELVATIDNLETYETNLDPNLPPLYRCSYATLAWTGSGFVHTGLVPCTMLGYWKQKEGPWVYGYPYYVPGELPTFADMNGDGLPDQVRPYNAAGWMQSNNPNDPPQFVYSPAWKIALNNTSKPGVFDAPVKQSQWKASAGIVSDLNGDGRPELTNEIFMTSLTYGDVGEFAPLLPDSIHMPVILNGRADGYREFGDFNGDGLQDMLRLVQEDPTNPGILTGQIFWNTGNGFYPDSHTLTVQVDVHPDWAKNIATRLSNSGIHVADMNNDGLMDLIVFNNDPMVGSKQSTPRIEILLSKGDGTFTELGIPVTAGTRIDTKYWLDNTLRPIMFYADREQNDVLAPLFEAAVASLIPGGGEEEGKEGDNEGDGIPGTNISLQSIPFQNYLALGAKDETPGMASGWNLATLADVDGDGRIDIVRHVGGNDPNGGFEVLQQTGQRGDELIAVFDEPTIWPELSVEYSSEWSDRLEANDSYQCTYPLECLKGDLRVVRSVTSRIGLTDLKVSDDPLKLGHTWQYSYRDPIANRQGLGFFGFSEFRVWDTEPTNPVETITTFDLRTPDASGKHYPGVGIPLTVTVVQPILKPGQGKPANATARVTRSTHTYELRPLNSGATYAVFPQSTHTSKWEEAVAISWSGQGPDHQHVSGYTEPANPALQVSTQVTVDDYGNTIDAVTQTTKGLHTQISTPTANDTANWRLGMVMGHTVTTLESQKNALPMIHTTAYTYTSKGQLETVQVEPNNPDPTITATTTFDYDDYGLPTSITTTVANEPARTRHMAYANAWPGAPDEHLYVSEVWADHDNPACVIDCRPAAWVLTHPSYGLPIVTMDRNGVQSTVRYDGHGRPVSIQTDGELPMTLDYSGRPDSYGGYNGTQLTTSIGLQQVFNTRNARGATLRTSFVGFDGQWVNRFFTYDPLGRHTGISRPSAGAPSAWTNYQYDSLGRQVSTTYPDNSSTKNTYTGLFQTDQWDARNDHSYAVRDVDGRLMTSGTLVPVPGCGQCAPQDVKATYQYSATATGALRKVLDDQGNITQTQYDRRYRAVQRTDPSRGTTTATYNGFDEAKQTVHVASGETQTQAYDDLGRVVTTTSPDGVTIYSWDTATNGIGRLARALSPDQIQTEYRYDTLGRLAGIDQTDELKLAASLDLDYDPQTGQLTSIGYPDVPGRSRFRAAYAYNGYGYLTKVSDASPNQPPRMLEQILARNVDLGLVDAIRGESGMGAVGGVIQDHRDYDMLMGRLLAISASHAGMQRLNVAYDYDPDGLVKTLTTTDEVAQIQETFEHDALHRLVHASRVGQAGLPFSSTMDETYDSIGNRIDTVRNGQLVEHRSYGSNGQKPYALTQRTVYGANQLPKIVDHVYDDLGRLVQDPQRTVTWTAFDLPKTLTQNGQNWTFRYDANGSRVKKSGPDGTTTYLSGLYEKHESNAAATQHTFHVMGSDGSVADLNYTEPSNPTLHGVTTVRYPLSDGLDTTKAVADNNGTVSEHDYYDSWGLRSNPDGTPLSNLNLFHSLISGGFTGQEHDDALGLINMKGRMYDPTLGRFLSPDPLISVPAFSQSWNTYSYVLNSPLNFTDPTGYELKPGITDRTAYDDGRLPFTTSADSNYTSVTGNEVIVSDPSRPPDAGALASGITNYGINQRQAANLANEIHRAHQPPPTGKPATPKDGSGEDPWRWTKRRDRDGSTSLQPPQKKRTHTEAWRQNASLPERLTTADRERLFEEQLNKCEMKGLGKFLPCMAGRENDSMADAFIGAMVGIPELKLEGELVESGTRTFWQRAYRWLRLTRISSFEAEIARYESEIRATKEYMAYWENQVQKYGKDAISESEANELKVARAEIASLEADAAKARAELEKLVMEHEEPPP